MKKVYVTPAMVLKEVEQSDVVCSSGGSTGLVQNDLPFLESPWSEDQY